MRRWLFDGWRSDQLFGLAVCVAVVVAEVIS